MGHTKNNKVKWILLAIITIFAILEFKNLINGKPYDKAISIGYFFAAIYSLFFGYVVKNNLNKIASKISNKTLAFVLAGSFGAFMVETIIWVAQTVLKTENAAIHKNIFIDLTMTMPFYLVLTYLFAKKLLNRNLTFISVAFLGGFYEMLADGVFANVLHGNIMGVLISPFLIPVFVVVYSPILLVPFLIFSNPNQYGYKTSLKEFLFPGIAVFILPLSIFLGMLLAKLSKL